MLKIAESKVSPQRPSVSASLRVSKKYKKQSIRKKLWRKECKNLKAIVPTVAHKKVSEVTVIEEAIDYIEELHQAIAQRLGYVPGDQFMQPGVFPSSTLLKEHQLSSREAPKVWPMPVRVPFVDAAFLSLLQAKGAHSLWGKPAPSSVYQKPTL